MLKLSIEKKSILLFGRSMELLGDIFICCQELNNALNAYII